MVLDNIRYQMRLYTIELFVHLRMAARSAENITEKRTKLGYDFF